MKNGENSSIACWIQETDRFPRAFEWPRFCLSISDHRRNDQVRVIKGRAKRMREDIAKLAAFVNGTRSGHAHVAGDAAGCGELAEQVAQPISTLRNLRIDL